MSLRFRPPPPLPNSLYSGSTLRPSSAQVNRPGLSRCAGCRQRHPIQLFAYRSGFYLLNYTTITESDGVSLPNIRSIDRPRLALHSLFVSLGGRTAAIHVVRFNLLGRSYRLATDIKFAEKIVKAYDRKKLHALKLQVRTGEGMALRIHMGDIGGCSRRVAGSRSAQAKMTAFLGPSKCKIFCRNIILRNRKRFLSSRLSRPVVASLDEGIKIILANKWELFRIGKKALKTSYKLIALHDTKDAL